MAASEGVKRIRIVARTLLRASAVSVLLGVICLIAYTRPATSNGIEPFLVVVLMVYLGVIPFVAGGALMLLAWVLDGFFAPEER